MEYSQEEFISRSLERFLRRYEGHDLIKGYIDDIIFLDSGTASFWVNPCIENPFERSKYEFSVPCNAILDLDLKIGNEVYIYGNSIAIFEMANISTGKIYDGNLEAETF